MVEYLYICGILISIFMIVGIDPLYGYLCINRLGGPSEQSLAIILLSFFMVYLGASIIYMGIV